MIITVKELALKYEVSEKEVRRILRKHNIKKTQYYWQWREGTKALSKVNILLLLSRLYQDFNLN